MGRMFTIATVIWFFVFVCLLCFVHPGHGKLKSMQHSIFGQFMFPLLPKQQHENKAINAAKKEN